MSGEAQITASEAEELAGRALGVKGLCNAHLVYRLDGGKPYFLVIFGESGRAHAIAAIDSMNGAVMLSAKFEQPKVGLLLDKAKAIEMADCEGRVSAARLVWAPSRATLSPFYPVWELACDCGPIYVDQNGKLWPSLLPAGPG